MDCNSEDKDGCGINQNDADDIRITESQPVALDGQPVALDGQTVCLDGQPVALDSHSVSLDDKLQDCQLYDQQKNEVGSENVNHETDLNGQVINGTRPSITEVDCNMSKVEEGFNVDNAISMDVISDAGVDEHFEQQGHPHVTQNEAMSSHFIDQNIVQESYVVDIDTNTGITGNGDTSAIPSQNGELIPVDGHFGAKDNFDGLSEVPKHIGTKSNLTSIITTVSIYLKMC